MTDTVVINLFGGPGNGKSTIAAHLFSLLKMRGINCELVTEFAKQLTWSNRHDDLTCQPYVFGKQLSRMCSLIGKVTHIITDSPLLLSSIYCGPEWPDSFKQSVCDIFDMFDNVNYLLYRTKEYNPCGRNQTVEESKMISNKIETLLYESNYLYTVLPGNLDSCQYILGDLLCTK